MLYEKDIKELLYKEYNEEVLKCIETSLKSDVKLSILITLKNFIQDTINDKRYDDNKEFYSIYMIRLGSSVAAIIHEIMNQKTIEFHKLQVYY